MLIKWKSSSLPRNLALETFGELPIVFSTKVNLLCLHYSTARRCFLLHLIKQNCLLKTFLGTVILITQVSLYLFSLLELIWNTMQYNISATPKMVKKVIMNLDLLKAYGPDCIPVVVLKECESELSYILAELWRSLVFQIVGRFHQWSLYLKMLGKGLQLETTALLVFFVWLVKSLKSLEIIELLIMWSFYGFTVWF